MNRWTLALTTGAAAFVSCPAVMAEAAKVLAVSGEASIEGTRPRELKRGDPVDAGDVIVTRDGSSAQLLMADGSRLEVRASSRVRIDSLALPSSIEHPGLSDRKRTSGSNIGTLLSGSLSATNPTALGNETATRELHTPFGRLAVAGAKYAAELCSGECSDRAGQSGLRIAVDEGTVTFADGARTVALTGPTTEFIASDAASRAASTRTKTPESNEPDASGSGPTVPPSLASLDAGRANVANRSIDAQSLLGRPVDLIDPELPFDSRVSSAIVVPGSRDEWFVTASTDLSDMQSFNSSGNLVQFNAPFGGSAATYLDGTSALLDAGRNGSSGIRWGRWSGGAATIGTLSGSQQLDLQDQSLHWIAGPIFEAPPQIAMSGETYFVLSGGTNPTDSLGHVGLLSSATLQANFTTQQVNAALSLNMNGYNWFASGSGSLATGTPRFNGTFNTVIDGRLPGAGAYSGFLSAGALSSDQLNGAGLSYRLTDDSGQLGSVYGVVAYVPGPPMGLSAPAVIRDVAYAVGKLNASQIAGGVASNSRGQLTLSQTLALARFNAPVPDAAIGGLSSGTARLIDNGVNEATGIRWGRWQGGAIDVTTPPASSQVNDLSTQSLHWIFSNEYATVPVLPQSGTATYTLIGNTAPTDTLGNTGTLGSASFNADFTNRFVTSQLTLNINGVDWYASGHATYGVGNNRFEGAYDDVRIENLASGQGTLYGFFTHPRVGNSTSPGAGLSFNLADNTRQLGVVSGVLAYAQGGAGATVTPLPPGSRDIAFIAPALEAIGPQAIRAAADNYALDSNFELVSLPGVTDSGTIDSARYGIGTSTVVASDVSPLVMLRWGRWSGGTANVTNLLTNTSRSIDLSQRSLHWIEGADAATPIMPVTGTATYALIGGTVPTDRAGNLGVLNGASLSADFTHQQVAAAFDVTVNNVNVVALGTGNIGVAQGLQPHQFGGTVNAGAVSNSAATPHGSFSGFFTSPGGTQSGVPGGAGVTYTISDGQGLTVDGAAAFRNQ
jgi:hypothetical protein